MTNIYSSRKIELALRENINFMWLSSMTIVDHTTINGFRSDKLKDSFKEIFKQVVLMLANEGLITLKNIYTDGTKIEAQAGRYTFVWGNSIKTNKLKMLTQLEELWKYAQSIDNDDEPNPEPNQFKEISKEVIHKSVAQIDAKLSGNDKASSKAKAKLRQIKNNFVTNLEKYEQQEAILGNRNSYSKTETKTLKPHLADFEQTYGEEIFNELETITADAGYGSEENYDALEEKGITAYVKYNTFEKEQDKNYQKNTKLLARKICNTTKKKIIMYVQQDKKCTKLIRVKKTRKQVMNKTSHIIKPKTAKAVRFEVNVLKPKKTEAQKEIIILKGTNKKQENYS